MTARKGHAAKAFTWTDIACLREVAEAIEIGFGESDEEVPRAWTASLKRLRSIADRLEGRLKGGKTGRKRTARRKLRETVPGAMTARRKAKRGDVIPTERGEAGVPRRRSRRDGDDRQWSDLPEGDGGG